MDLLEEEVQRLKRQYSSRWHPRIDRNFEWVSQEMKARPASIAIQEGRMALGHGLPSPTPAPRPKAKKKPGSSKRLSRRK